jgi:hypothetical protein
LRIIARYGEMEIEPSYPAKSLRRGTNPALKL